MNKIYGYVRISTSHQSIERQIRNILQYNQNAIIIEEIFTGTKIQGRDEFDKLLNRKIKPNDTIIFDEVSRMSRNSIEGFAIYKSLFEQDINLIFLKEPHINTSTYRNAIENKLQMQFNSGDDATDSLMTEITTALNKYILKLAERQIQIAFEQSEAEIQHLSQRTKEGILTSKLNGKIIGGANNKGKKLQTKKSIECKKKIQKVNKKFNGPYNNRETWEDCGIDKNTFYKYLREIEIENAS